MSRVLLVALIATECSATASIPNPSEAIFHMFASASTRQLLAILDKGALFEIRVVEFESHVWNTHIFETLMTIDVEPLPWHVDLLPNDLIIARASHFPTYPAYFNKSGVFKCQLPNFLGSHLHNFSVKGNQNDNLAFLAFKFHSNFHLFPVCFQNMNNLLLTLAF